VLSHSSSLAASDRLEVSRIAEISSTAPVCSRKGGMNTEESWLMTRQNLQNWLEYGRRVGDSMISLALARNAKLSRPRAWLCWEIWKS
jgi:hypothetical protein